MNHSSVERTMFVHLPPKCHRRIVWQASQHRLTGSLEVHPVGVQKNTFITDRQSSVKLAKIVLYGKGLGWQKLQ